MNVDLKTLSEFIYTKVIILKSYADESRSAKVVFLVLR